MTKYNIFPTRPITLAKLEKSQTPFVDKKKSRFITFMTSDFFSLFLVFHLGQPQTHNTCPTYNILILYNTNAHCL